MEYQIITTNNNKSIVFTKSLNRSQICYLTILCLCKSTKSLSCIFKIEYKISYKQTGIEATRIDKKIVSEISGCDCDISINKNNINVYVLGINENIIWELNVDEWVI